ncbi:mycofactocin-coupled SDR family oxidoreductase [Pseudonocardia yuanmonensis]|uniref:Mycofactocin-coupled SDR family oxidoreductase n=1 Tax=Pseudonocardia yuanmonensis TaxID=1095914 RepID=A0ABP8VVF5_9PSEU
MGRVEGKVALITGAARGQGRTHALRLAEEGADIIAIDLCSQLDTVPYALASEADLEETAKQVEDRDRRILTRQADVRDLGQLQAAVADGVSELGHLDIVCGNAGILSSAPAWELSEESWQEMIDVNLTGVWKTIRATVPQMIEQGTGGSIILTSSIFGLQGAPNVVHYVAAKHGVTGMMRALAIELAPHGIRVNSVHPTTVDTAMVQNPMTYELLLGRSGASRAEAEAEVKAMNALPVPWVEAVDISNAVLYLASDEARYVTGTTHIVDAGSLSPYKIPHA